jgi:hypothetical protein
MSINRLQRPRLVVVGNGLRNGGRSDEGGTDNKQRDQPQRDQPHE